MSIETTWKNQFTKDVDLLRQTPANVLYRRLLSL